MRSAELKQLETEFINAHGDFGIEKIDASEVEFGRLIEMVSSLPFLAARRMLIIHDLSANKSAGDKINELLDAVADSTDLIIVERKFDKRSGLYKALKKHSDFREFNELDERGLANWLVAMAQERGGKISQSDANYLVQRYGPDQMGLHNELDKLLSYSPEITKQSIDLLTEPMPQGSVFDLLDAAFAGDKKRAIKLYEEQRKQQAEPQMIMGMIAWQLHILAVVKFNENSGSNAIASSAKLSPYVVNKALGLTRKMTQIEVKKLVEKALKLDVRLKSEQLDADDAVQHFLLTI